ncbi:MAG TPA: beta-ketoacyl-[acyl-carrier-protein] synthase family protein [Rhodopila sp.]|uniref:beta-ketoacyl-[acyl-carrier-protein] synthase family protein n=1 Tax=Rhodopila sp. TaxID=2480087 RepID=UPI002C6D5A91|nr:beta-ketoacyl-[acyl-carrier-protein] synthase family protein [Rhodopila sp.]HVY16326.1 beta-ketoacyl-[acyl-carrier-protein] synthase family protein [Rhodopila sp.]
MRPLAITATCIASSLGLGLGATLTALRDGISGLRPCRFETVDLPTFVGEADGLDNWRLDSRFDCRNNRLARLALAQDGFETAVEAAKTRYGPRRIGVFLGTSTSGILQIEQAYRHREPDGSLSYPVDYAGTQSTFSVAEFVLTQLGITGPSLVVSSACASTTKVFATAARMIEAGLCDAAIVGGADSLCLTTLYGFNALQLLAPGPCRPFDADREGLSIGEAAGFALLERPEHGGANSVAMLGVGESSDAHHMSAPRPDGAGAMVSMTRALAASGLRPDAIDYINLHGTATRIGDAAEDLAVLSVFGDGVPCSSTKGHTGHTLGASGIVEAIIGTLAIRHGLLPGSPHTASHDPALRCRYITLARPGRVERMLSNSFGFGGSNASLVLGRSA